MVSDGGFAFQFLLGKLKTLPTPFCALLDLKTATTQFQFLLGKLKTHVAVSETQMHYKGRSSNATSPSFVFQGSHRLQQVFG